MDNQQSNKHDDNYFFELGISELDAGNFENAIEAFKQAIKGTPDDPRLYNNLGIAYELSNNYEEARSAYEKAVSVNPKNTSSYNNLAGLSLLEGKPADAAQYYESAISSDPMYIEPHMNIARMFIEMREFSLAEPYVRKVLEIEQDNAEALNLLGVITSVTERSEEAVLHFQNAIRSDANQASVFSNLGAALRRIGDKKRAILAFEKSYELNPNSISIMNNLGVLYRETGYFEKSESFLNRARSFYPDNPFPYLSLADLYIQLERYDEALENLKQYFILMPLDMDTLFKTCGIARMAGRLTEVIEEMQTFIDESEQNDKRRDTVTNWLSSVKTSPAKEQS